MYQPHTDVSDSGTAEHVHAIRGATANSATAAAAAASDSGGDVLGSRAARHRKRDRGGGPKPLRPTHFVALPLCQVSTNAAAMRT